MARRYSNLYNSIVNRATSGGQVVNSTSYVYAGPHAHTRGDEVVIVATYNLANGSIAFASADDLYICRIQDGLRLMQMTISSGDDDLDSGNTFTFDLGFTGSLSAILNDSTALQGGAETTLGIEELEEVVVPAGGSDLILTSQAGALISSGTIYFTVRGVYP
jgi:hypothetical protein